MDYDGIKKQITAILDKYKHYKYFYAVNKELNDPNFYIEDDIMGEIKSHDTNGYIVDKNDVIELKKLLKSFNEMSDVILPENHGNFVEDLSDLLQEIKSTDPHKIGSMHIGTFGNGTFGRIIVKNQGGKKRSKKRSNRRSKKRSKKHSKKNRSRRTTSHRRRSRAARSI
jgi:hypothetical protein